MCEIHGGQDAVGISKISDHRHVILAMVIFRINYVLSGNLPCDFKPDGAALCAGINGMVLSIRDMTGRLRYERDHDTLTGLALYEVKKRALRSFASCSTAA